jgi:hypothetical protein
MVPVLALSTGLPLPVRVVLGMVAYGVGSLVFRNITRAELDDLLSSLRRGNPPADEVPESGDVVLETAIGPLAVPLVPPGDEEPAEP